MNKVLALAAITLCAGCAGQEINPDAAKTRLADSPFCLRDTGTYIHRADGECAGDGRVYTRDDLNRTGRPGVGDALNALLPR